MISKCHRCWKITNTVLFEIILRINNEDYRLLGIYCDNCFKSIQKNMKKDIKVKLFTPFKRENTKLYSEIEKRRNLNKKSLIIDKLDEVV